MKKQWAACFPTVRETYIGIDLELRPLTPSDTEVLTAYFLGLSDTTKGLYGPHPFDAQTARKLCESSDTDKTVRVVALDRGAGRIIGYFILDSDPGPGDRKRYSAIGLPLGMGDWELAPSVADDYQDRKIGSRMMAYCIETLNCLNIRSLVLMGGVKERNVRGRHFYAKHGFEQVGEFDNGEMNYDMVRRFRR